jgi:hypothetical protein
MVSYSANPTPIDAFSRMNVEMFNEKEFIGVPTAFQTFFGRSETGARTLWSDSASVVDIDIIRGNEKIAALVPRGTISRDLGTGQKNLNVQKRSSFSRRFPLAEEEGDISADQLEFRVAGEGSNENRSRLQRMRSLALDLNEEAVRRLIRMDEYLCTQSILEGKMPAIIGTTDPDLLYDFRRKSTHITALTTSWNSGSADIMGDIDAACELIRADGHVNPDMAVFGSKVMQSFLEDDGIKALADNRRIELIQVSMQNPVPPKFAPFIEGGFQARGRLRTAAGFELWIFTSTDVYTDSAGDPAKYMPEDQALFCYSGARCDRYFGPPEVLPMIPMRRELYNQLFGFNMDNPPMPANIKNAGSAIVSAGFYFDAYAPDNWKSVTCRVQHAPIFATTMTDAFVTYKDVYVAT